MQILFLFRSFEISEDNFKNEKVQVSKDQAKAQSDKDSQSKNRGGENLN